MANFRAGLCMSFFLVFYTHKRQQISFPQKKKKVVAARHKRKNSVRG